MSSVFVFSPSRGSSADIICSCIIIQATASPQGSPAETELLFLYIYPVIAHAPCASLWSCLSLSLSRMPNMVVRDTSDGWGRTQSKTGCMAQELLWFKALSWSLRMVIPECPLGHSDSIDCCGDQTILTLDRNEKELIKRSAEPSGLKKCARHHCGNTSSLRRDQPYWMKWQFGKCRNTARMQIYNLY